MINFKPIAIEDKSIYEPYLAQENDRGCEFSFANVYLWGQQSGAVLNGHFVLLSRFNRYITYLYPLGNGDKKAVLDAIWADAAERGIPCCLSGLNEKAQTVLNELYPDRFTFSCNRDSFDYVYAIDDLADLKGKKYHRKRNHFNRFCENNPNYTVEPLSEINLPRVKDLVDKWYETRSEDNPASDYLMEKIALEKAFAHFHELAMEGLVLRNGEKVLAVTMGSRLSADTFDVHFEKARLDTDGAYTAINCEFARYIRKKYPEIRFLDREDDMGLEGLRKAKLSYYPHHLIQKYLAVPSEEKHDH